ncbi:MAG: lipopolysaccharide biosynthesis protein [Alphaproteobacteria bacterium]|nr:lipopolysaccharide biosynthesis protein [Alphaproteobacteria bacterium]NNF24957.1 lipopolysaccharide biosynthesis protein [Paracoccaceae bacterium]
MSSDPRDALFDTSALREDLGRLTGQSARVVLVFAAIRLLVTLLTTAILARLVPPAEQGLVALTLPAILIASGLSEFGLSQAVIQRETVTHRLVTTLFWVNVTLGLVLTSTVALLGDAAARFYKEDGVSIIFVVLSPYILFTVLNTQYVAILRRQLRIKALETASFVTLIAASVISVSSATMGAGPYALVLQLLLHQFFTFLALAWLTRWIPSPPWTARLTEARSALAFGGFLAAERLLGSVANNFPLLLTGRFFTEVQAAHYFRAESFAMMPSKRIGAPIAGAFIPALSRLQTEPEAFRAMFQRLASRANLIFVPIALFLYICADAVVLILLGEGWEGSTPILRLLAVFAMALLTINSFSWTLVASGQGRALFIWRIFSSFLLITSLLISVQFGLIAMVTGQVACQVLINGPLIAGFAIRTTPIDLTTIRRTFLSEAIFAAVTAGGGFALRASLDLSTFAECIAVGLMIVAFAVIRIGAFPELRRDVLTTLGRK